MGKGRVLGGERWNSGEEVLMTGGWMEWRRGGERKAG